MASETDLSPTAKKQTAGTSQTRFAKAAEKQRLGEALRENLRRRKAQRQGRSEGRSDLAPLGPAETAE
jgi:hypothetical protein